MAASDAAAGELSQGSWSCSWLNARHIHPIRATGAYLAATRNQFLTNPEEPLSDEAARRLAEVFAADDATRMLQAVWTVKEQVRALLRTDSQADAAAAKEELKDLLEAAGRPEDEQSQRHRMPVVGRD